MVARMREKGQKALPKCGAKKSDGSGDTCAQPAGFGTQHLGWGLCKYHGGNSPAGITSAARKEVGARLGAYGAPVDVDPAAALLGEVRRSAGIVAWLGAVIARFTSGIDLDDGTIKARDVVQTLGENGREAAVWVELFFRERRQLAQVAKMALDAGVAERQVQLQEEQGKLLATVIQGILTDLGLTTEQATAAPSIVRRHLMAIESASS